MEYAELLKMQLYIFEQDFSWWKVGRSDLSIDFPRIKVGHFNIAIDSTRRKAAHIKAEMDSARKKVGFRDKNNNSNDEKWINKMRLITFRLESE